MLDSEALGCIGIWEDSGEVVAVAHYESSLGEVFFEFHPDYGHLKTELLEYAEANLVGESKDGERFVHVFISDRNSGFIDLLQSQGYQHKPGYDRPLAVFRIPETFPEITLPAGYRLKSLAEDNDLHKIHRALWRGFNHPGEPPEEGIKDRAQMQSVPNFRKDLNIVVEAPDGYFVAYSGTWYEPVNRYAYVEPVATDPDYRRLGLGRAAVLEGIRRCGKLGASVAYVGSDLPFYLSFGFEVLYTAQCWRKVFISP